MSNDPRPDPADPLSDPFDAVLPAPSRQADTPVVMATVVEPIAPPKPRLRWQIPLLLFVATCATTYDRGGPVYAGALMTILLCHEFGHYLQARRHGVRASLPFFLPMPFSIIGTMGAVIGMDARVKDRRALFDIGISGPLAGLVPTLVFCCVGLQAPYSEVKVPDGSFTQIGEPLVFHLIADLIHGPLPPGQDIVIGPLAWAGWVGLLITAINLFPIGQLDGGHILYALLRRRAHLVAKAILFLAVAGIAAAVMVFGQPQMAGWSVMILLLLIMGPAHPPTARDDVPLGRGRIILGWLTLAFLIFAFTPNPLPGD